MKCGQSMTPRVDAAYRAGMWLVQGDVIPKQGAVTHGTYKIMTDTARQLESSLAEAVAALTELSDDAIVLSADYLSAFETKPYDATVQGWSKAQWVRLLATWNKARAIIAKHSG